MVIAGEVVPGEAAASTPATEAKFPGQANAGRRLTFEAQRAGLHTIAVTSYAFDTYVIVRDGSGAVVGENDDGPVSTHSLVEVELGAGTSTIEVVALHDGAGTFEVRITPGAAPVLKEAERLRANSADAEHRVGLVSAQSGTQSAEHARALNQWARSLEREGRYQEASETALRVVRVCEEVYGPEDRNTASALNHRGTLLTQLGEYGEARAAFERALTIRKAALGATDALTGQSLNSLARLRRLTGDLEGARALYEEALAISEAARGPHHRDTATGLNNLAVVMRQLGRRAEAGALFERALAIRREQLGVDHPNTASTLNNLARLRREEGALDEAERLYREALTIYEAKLGPDHPRTAVCVHNLGQVMRERGDLAGARPMFERSIQTTERVHGARHPNVGLARASLGLLLLEAGDREGAWAAVAEGMDERAAHVERILMAQSEHERYLFLGTIRDTLEAQLSAARAAGTPEAEQAAYAQVLAWKGRVARIMASSRALDAGRLSETQSKLVEELHDVQAELSALVLAPSMNEARDARLVELGARRNELELAWLRSVGLEASGDALGFAAIAKAMPADTAVIDFLVHRRFVVDEDGGRWDEGGISAWVTGAGAAAPTWVDLGPRTVVEEAVQGFLKDLVARRGLRRVEVEEGVDLNKRVRDLVWAPLSPHLGPAKRVVISPDGVLGTLPFETLQGEDGAYLVEQYAITYLQDLASLPGLLAGADGDAPPVDAAALVIGGVDFMSRGETSPTANGSGQVAMRSGSSTFWGKLPATEYESNVVAEMHEATHRNGTQLKLQGAAPTEERVKSELAGRYDVLHLATHGFFHPRGLPEMWEMQTDEETGERRLAMRAADAEVSSVLPGLLSGLVLAGANVAAAEGADDGFLTAEEVGWTGAAGARLVVLSACETGLGQVQAGEGLIGLRRAFRIAGAETVISSLWQVKDESASELMQRFYQNMWLRGMGTHSALRAAQLEMLNRNRMEQGDGWPSTWGAFILDGDWR